MNSHIRIQLDGKNLVLPSDFKLDIEEQNPLFNSVEKFSYPVSLPLSGNRSVVRNVDDFNSDERVSRLEHLPMRCWVDGFPFRSGVAVVQEDEEVESSVTINMDASTQSFSDLIGDLKCNEIPVKDEIVIGEKIGNVHVSATYTFSVKADIRKHRDFHFSKSGNNVTGIVEPQALGFSYPGVCELSNDSSKASKQFAKQETIRSYPHNNSVVVPKVMTSYINTSAAYGETLPNGMPAYYANARICYKHYALGDDGSTSSDTVAQEDSTGIYEDIYPYWVLDANRPQSGICFYVLYFLDCLFAYLGVDFDKSALMGVGDFRRLVFFTTKCAYTTRKATQYYADKGENEFFFSNIDDINEWLSSRGCGGQLEIEKPETKTVDSFDYTDKTDSNKTYHYKVGDDNCRSITIKASYDSTPKVTADIYEMLASGENFPDESVQTVLDSFSAAFGVKFDYDYEQKKVTAYLLRDVFRQKDVNDAIRFSGKITKMYPITEKILGFRMRYSQEQDKKEQQQNVKDAAKGINQNYETDYNYIDYQESKVIFDRHYTDFFKSLSPTDEHCYIDKTTGNAYRIKRDKDAKILNDFRPVLFEVGGYKGVELGDCSEQNEDYIDDRTISFEPVIFNDVNYYQELDKLSTQTRIEDENGIIGNFNSGISSVLAAFVDEEMEHEFVEQRIRNALGDYYVYIYVTEKLKLVESYNPEGTNTGNSPLQTYKWGTALAVMRGGGADMDVQTYDFNYDSFGTGKWRTVSGCYAMASDCIDLFGNDYDYNGKLDGVGYDERFSLKIRAFKNPDWAEQKGISLCNADTIDLDTLKVTRKVKSRGLFDSFLSEYAHFVLNRKKFKIKALVTAAQLADISNHWKSRWNINGKIGYINKVTYSLSVERGVEDVEIEFFSM